MNKAVKIAVGVIVVISAVAAGGAWYTGTQLPGVINDALVQVNQSLDERMAGQEGTAKVELVSLDRHLFSSTAHYRLLLQGPRFASDSQGVEFLIADHIEHGPLPLSRLKALNLMPVMAASNYSLEQNPSSASWFAATHGVAPFTGRVVMTYDHATEGTLELVPVDITNGEGGVKFSGLKISGSTSSNSEKYQVQGTMGSLQVDAVSNGLPVHAVVTDLSFNSGGVKGRSGLYLGHTDAKSGQIVLQISDKPALEFKDFSSNSLSQEVEGSLSGELAYQVGMIRYGDHDIGSSQMSWKISNFDTAASLALTRLYQSRILPQARLANQAKAMGQPYKLQLSPADQQQILSQLTALLAGKPHIELENLSLKTPHGESHVSLAIDLANPGPFAQPPADLYKKAIGQLDLKVLLSKPMISDLVAVQAAMQGAPGDAALIARQATDFSDTVGGMAVMFNLAKVDGSNIVSDLHYADNVVDFNGAKMPPEQFVAQMMAEFARVAPTVPQ